MNSKWFVEDRALPAVEQGEAIEQTKKALMNSTLISRRLTRILDEMIQSCYRDDEDFDKPNWELKHVSNISRRKTLKEIKTLLQFKKEA